MNKKFVEKKITRRNSEIMKRLAADFIESMLIASSLIIRCLSNCTNALVCIQEQVSQLTFFGDYVEITMQIRFPKKRVSKHQRILSH